MRRPTCNVAIDGRVRATPQGMYDLTDSAYSLYAGSLASIVTRKFPVGLFDLYGTCSSMCSRHRDP